MQRTIFSKSLPVACFAMALLCCPVFCNASVDLVAKDSVKKRVPVMKRLEDFALKDNFVSKLVRTMFVFTTDVEVATEDTIQASESQYNKFENKPIREINIYVLNVFGYTVYDPVCYDITWIEKLGNRLHYPTRSWIVKNKLLFEKGDKIDAFKVSETERLLRQSSYINDARIVVLPVSDSSDSVDVKVYVQDVWGIGVGVTGDPLVPNGDISINDLNFLGLGQRLDTKFWFNEAYYNKWKFSGSYNFGQLGRSYISGRLYYLTENRNQISGINFNRPFYSPTTPWAGGLTVEMKKIYFDFAAQDSSVFKGYNTIWQEDAWAGYAFKPGPSRSLYKKKSQIVVAGRIASATYVKKHELSQALNESFPNEIIYLGSIGYSFREYYRDRFIFGFGRTEDIPLGHLATYTAGINRIDGRERFYSGIKLAFGKTHSALGYMYGSVETGGYLHNRDVEQGVLALQVLYFTNLHPIGRWQIRHFLWNRFTLGYNRKPGELLNINEGEGLRVFSTDRIRGTQKLVSNYEINFFTPYTPLGFRMVGVMFIDLALIGTQENPFYRSRLYQGYGLGLRLKNERLVFNTFQLSLHYYPGASDFGEQQLRHYHTEHPYYRFQGFEASAPYTVGF